MAKRDRHYNGLGPTTVAGEPQAAHERGQARGSAICLFHGEMDEVSGGTAMGGDINQTGWAAGCVGVMYELALWLGRVGRRQQLCAGGPSDRIDTPSFYIRCAAGTYPAGPDAGRPGKKRLGSVCRLVSYQYDMDPGWCIYELNCSATGLRSDQATRGADVEPTGRRQLNRRQQFTVTVTDPTKGRPVRGRAGCL